MTTHERPFGRCLEDFIVGDVYRHWPGKTITEAGGRIVIEGHTDDVPLSGHNRFRSNWDLSGARAGAVADYLSERGGVPRERLMVRGMADTKPVAANDTREGRAKNRRIEILVDAFGS